MYDITRVRCGGFLRLCRSGVFVQNLRKGIHCSGLLDPSRNFRRTGTIVRSTLHPGISPRNLPCSDCLDDGGKPTGQF